MTPPPLRRRCPPCPRVSRTTHRPRASRMPRRRPPAARFQHLLKEVKFIISLLWIGPFQVLFAVITIITLMVISVADIVTESDDPDLSAGLVWGVVGTMLLNSLVFLVLPFLFFALKTKRMAAAKDKMFWEQTYWSYGVMGLSHKLLDTPLEAAGPPGAAAPAPARGPRSGGNGSIPAVAGSMPRAQGPPALSAAGVKTPTAPSSQDCLLSLEEAGDAEGEFGQEVRLFSTTALLYKLQVRQPPPPPPHRPVPLPLKVTSLPPITEIIAPTRGEQSVVPPPPLYKPRPCPSYSRRRDRNNCVRNLITYQM